MAGSGRLADYLGQGTASLRPVSLTLQADTIGLWLSTDTGELDFWDGTEWTPFVPATHLAALLDVDTTGLEDGMIIYWNAATNKFKFEAVPNAGIPDAPDATMYVRELGEWVALPAYPDVSGFITDAPDGSSYFRKAGAWVKYVAPAPAPSALVQLTDYDNTTPAVDSQVPTWDNTAQKWKPKTPTGGGGGGGAVAAAQAHSWWRVWFPHGYGYFAYAVTNLEFRATPSGPTQCVGGTPYSSPALTEGTLAGMFDGDPGTYGATGNSPSGQIMNLDCGFGYHFATPVKVGEVLLQARNDGGNPLAATQTSPIGEVQFSDDGAKWYTAFEYRGDAPFALAEIRLLDNPYSALTGGSAKVGWKSLYNWNGATDAQLPSGTPIVVDVSQMTDALITFDGLTKANSASIDIRFSVDGGVTFDSSGNYHTDLNSNGGYAYADGAIYSNGGSSGPSLLTWIVSNLRSNNSPKPYIGSRNGVYVNHLPITHIQINIDATYTGGSFNVSGRLDTITVPNLDPDFNPPKAADFAQLYGLTGGLVLTDDPAGLYVQCPTPATGDRPWLAGKVIPNPTGDWWVEMLADVLAVPLVNYAGFGIAFCDDAGNKIAMMRAEYDTPQTSGPFLGNFTRTGGFIGNPAVPAYTFDTSKVKFRIEHHASDSTLHFLMRVGKRWIEVSSLSDTNLTGVPDRIGVGGFFNRAAANTIQAVIGYWKDSWTI